MSFADMMTLLFCLFMVLFAISSVNTSKFEALQKSLQDAFSGAVLDGGKSYARPGSDDEEDRSSPRSSRRCRRCARSTAMQQHAVRADAAEAAKAGQAGGAGLPGAQARAWTSSAKEPACRARST